MGELESGPGVLCHWALQCPALSLLIYENKKIGSFKEGTYIFIGEQIFEVGLDRQTFSSRGIGA